MKGGDVMLKYISGLFTGVLLGAFIDAALNAWIVSENPEASQKYTEYVMAATK
jgi:hypothetical protein